VRGVARGSLTVGDTVLFVTMMQQLYVPLTFFGSYYRQVGFFSFCLVRVFTSQLVSLVAVADFSRTGADQPTNHPTNPTTSLKQPSKPSKLHQIPPNPNPGPKGPNRHGKHV
jgi:hypothetical protein